MIHALGLAPSLDVVYTVGRLVPGAIHRPQEVVRLAGGKSLNLARALARLGHPVRALAPLGGRLGDEVAERLTGSGVELVRLTTTAATRMCVTVADEHAVTLTEVYELAPPADGGELPQVAEALATLEPGDWVVLSGSVPDGTDLGRLVDLLAGCRTRGARLVVDTHGAVLPMLVERARPDVVKINRVEAAELVGRAPAGVGEPDDLTDLGASVRALGVEVLVLTDGAAGAVGWSAEGTWRVRTDAAPGGYPVGSGDCFLAGLLAELVGGRPLPQALVAAAALGAANAALPGGAVFDLATLARLRDRTRAVRLPGTSPPTRVRA